MEVDIYSDFFRLILSHYLGTFFGGIVLGLILTLLVLGGLYAYRTYGSNQYQAVG
jgi:hypothetical protein